MSLLSGNVNHVWNTCRERQVNTYSSQESAALPLTLSVHMPLEQGITRETQLEELPRNQQPDCRARDVLQIWENRKSWEQRVKHELTRSSAGRTRPKQLTSRKKRPTQVVLQGVETLLHLRRFEQVEVQTYNLVNEEPGLIQVLSPKHFQIGQHWTLDERSVH